MPTTVEVGLGFDFSSGRMDVSAHPFSIAIGPGDARITVRYKPGNFTEGFFSAIHETGHAIYEKGLPPEHWGTPAGQSVSLGVHESQSRMLENMVARSLGFWRWMQPQLAERFPALASLTPEDMARAVNAAAPSLIRTEADEVTYNLHVLLRFELELALFRGELEPADLPQAWNEKMEALLGVQPGTARDGVMQDVHWSAGLFGYFPTYTLGNVYAGQLYWAAARDLGDLEEQFAAGNFSPLLGWLHEKIHSQGMRYWPRELMLQATGEEAGAGRFVTYLQNKYAMLYFLTL